jgi:hypothetical protein
MSMELNSWSSFALDEPRSAQDVDNWHVYRAIFYNGSYHYAQTQYSKQENRE